MGKGEPTEQETPGNRDGDAGVVPLMVDDGLTVCVFTGSDRECKVGYLEGVGWSSVSLVSSFVLVRSCACGERVRRLAILGVVLLPFRHAAFLSIPDAEGLRRTVPDVKGLSRRAKGGALTETKAFAFRPVGPSLVPKTSLSGHPPQRPTDGGPQQALGLFGPESFLPRTGVGKATTDT